VPITALSKCFCT